MGSRDCTNGVFQPTMQSRPISCHKLCTVEQFDKTTVTSSPLAGMKIRHNAVVKYNCIPGRSSVLGIDYKKTCVEGTMSPAGTYVCTEDCPVGPITRGVADKKIGGKVVVGTDVTYSCNKDHTTETTTLKRKC